jgi:hypothetical protein
MKGAAMKKFRITLPETNALDHRSLTSLGRFERGEPRELELSDEQVESLKGRGLDIEPLTKPKPQPKKDADEIESSGKESD